MTIGQLITTIFVILYLVLSIYSIKNLPNTDYNIKWFTNLWLVITSIIFVITLILLISCLIYYWNYKLF